MKQAAQSLSAPTLAADGSVNAIVAQEAQQIGRYRLLQLAVSSSSVQGSVCGRFLMARCVHMDDGSFRTDWGVYVRRPLFIVAAKPLLDRADAVSLTVLIPDVPDPGYRFLATRRFGETVNVLGPYGRSAELPDQCRHLLLATTAATAPLLLPAAEQILDRNGRVTVIVRDEGVDRGVDRGVDTGVDKGLLALYPISVEVNSVSDNDQYVSLFGDAVSWADAMIIADTTYSPQAWADAIRQHRLTLDDSFAQILQPSDLLCCTGACMACVVQRTNGSLTRACIHGPIFPLTSLAG